MSKGLEALEELLYYANLNFEHENERKTEFTNRLEQMDIDDNEENFKIIKKDLEVLEILKKHIYIMSEVKGGDTIISQSLGMSLDSRVNDNDFIKVKEWLEND